MKRVTLLQLLFIILFIPIMCRPGFAHKVRIFAWQDGNNIITEAMFSRGRPALNATISVVETGTGKELLSGTTDAKGLFSFPIPQTGSKELKIIVDAGDGHKNSWNYTLEESASKDKNTFPLQLQTSADGQAQNPPISEEATVNTLQTISTADLTRIIETALDKKLASINRTLAENSEKGPTLQDILGGIGYILGLAGIAAYMQSLKNKKE
jgi:nickel transport protein